MHLGRFVYAVAILQLPNNTRSEYVSSKSSIVAASSKLATLPPTKLLHLQEPNLPPTNLQASSPPRLSAMRTSLAHTSSATEKRAPDRNGRRDGHHAHGCQPNAGVSGSVLHLRPEDLAQAVAVASLRAQLGQAAVLEGPPLQSGECCSLMDQASVFMCPSAHRLSLGPGSATRYDIVMWAAHLGTWSGAVIVR